MQKINYKDRNQMNKISYHPLMMQLLYMTEKEMVWPARLKYQFREIMLTKQYLVGPRDAI